MEITLRQTTEADLPGIFRIQTDPLVQPHQYRLTSRDTIDAWKQQLFGGRQDGPGQFKSTTIVQRDEIIGHIIHTHYEGYGKKICSCGWNLAPTHWGQGITVVALSQLYDAFFGEQQIDLVVSDCFSNNQRCLRVLQKLNYEPRRIAPYDRLKISIYYRCLHWICGFQLSPQRWRSRLQVA